MPKIERTFMIDDDAAALLVQLAGGPRKQGEYLSEMIRQLARQDPLLTRVAELERELGRVKAELVRRAGEAGGDG